MDGEKLKKIFLTIIKFWKPLLYSALVLALAVFVTSVSFLAKSKSTGIAIGNTVGSIVGKASGSFDGWNTGYDEGKEGGLSAKDTTVMIHDALDEAGTLRVLSAKVLINNAHEVGKADDSIIGSLVGGKKYSAIYSYEGQVDFSIDLSKADISSGNGRIIIELPQPYADLIIDETKATKIADKQRFFLNGSDLDGIKAYNNSVAEIKNKAAEELGNYKSLLEMAKSSAQRQIEDLIKTVNMNHDEPIVRFKN